MSELAIRRERNFAVPRYQGTGKTEKTADAARSQKAVQTIVTISETLRQLMERISQGKDASRESRRTLQAGEAVLDEVRDSLDRIAELARESAEGKEPDRDALQAELEKLREGIARMLSEAVVGDKPLFVDGEVDLVDGVLSGDIDLEQLIEVIQRLLERMGTDSEQTVNLPTAAPALLALLAGMKGMNQELLMDLLAALENGDPVLTPETADSGAPAPDGAETPRSEPVPTAEYEGIQVSGQDLSEVSYHEKDGILTVNGTADVTIEGTGRAILIAGSGRITLQNVEAEIVTVDTEAARIFIAEESVLKKLDLREGASLTLEGGGLLRIGVLRAGEDAVLRLNGGAVMLEEEGTEPLTLPVVVEGPASLAARAVRVSNPDGKPLESFDLIWKTLLPGWKSVTGLELNGRQARLALREGDPVRLWLDKENPGYTVHRLVIQGKDAAGRSRTRYAYLRWNQRVFQKISMYPNPFDVTGGQPGRDWVYEEETHTLHILSAQVTGISGGVGVDANQIPFSGRIALADSVGAVELSLAGVVCRVSSGRAFSLGRENDVTLVLVNESSNLFESGAGCAGISLGEGTCLRIDCAGTEDGLPRGVLTAAGGPGSAGIGQDSGGDRVRIGPILILGAAAERQSLMGTVTIAGGVVTSTGEAGKDGDITLQVGEDTVLLPQFKLSVKVLQLDALNVETRESARTAMRIVDADRLRVARIQAVYGALYGQVEQSFSILHSVQAGAPLRNGAAASTLMEDILRRPCQAIQTHSGGEAEEVQQLLE